MVFQDDDEQLVAAALAGSLGAWEKLVRRYESRIFNYGLRLMGNSADAMDLLQEVFLGVYRNLHRFRGDSRFSSWIFRIAHNKAIDLNRRKVLIKGQTFSFDENCHHDELAGSGSGDGCEPEQQLFESRQNEQIQKLLGQLPLDQRLVVELKIYQSLTFDEIAQVQDISENTAKTRFYTALRKLKVIMEKSHALS